MPPTRLAAALALALAACSHARTGALVHAPVDEPSEAAPVAPASASDGAAPTSPAAAPAPAPAAEVHAASAKPGAARGALQGAGVVLYVLARICVAGDGTMILPCVVGVYFGWPYVVAAVGLGAAIGAVSGAEPREMPVGKPPEPPVSAAQPEATAGPAMAWGGGG